MMERRSPLRPMSPKRAAELAAQGVSRPWSTLTNSGAGLSRVAAVKDAKPKRPRDTGPAKSTVETVAARDHNGCAVCGLPVSGVRGVDFSVHHRRPRAAGGSSRTDTNGPQNLVLLHGSGVSGCHGRVEQNRAEAYANGWLVRQAQDPAEAPINHAVHGWVLLAADGSLTFLSPNRNDFTPA
ncbi:HNH endonuclease [Micromonospora sp. NPDC049891]|uniref:HNH endonuclease n=1 Tax=Micromonospora sp. NPDC049891 TaxID=3155655 RepID=UPI0033CD2841